jgi:hypothetical protein
MKEFLMQRIIASLMLCLVLRLVGCHEASPARDKSAPADGKVKVVAPGVSVEVEPKRDSNSPGKVKVNAPGVHVDVEKKPG